MLTYHWEKENDVIPINAIGMNTSILTLINLQSEDIGNYRCVATNGSGSSKSSYVAVAINGKATSFYLSKPCFVGACSKAIHILMLKVFCFILH